MSILGQTLSFPFRVDSTGGLAVTKTDDEIITQAIIDLIETKTSERKMLPNYGLSDVVFDVLDSTFATRLAFYVEEQIKNYIPAIQQVKVDAGSFENGIFIENALASVHKAAIRVFWWKRNESVPQELIYPTWRLLNQ